MLELEGFNDEFCPEEPDQNIIERLRNESATFDVPWQLTDPQLWANYCDNDLYYLDKEVRRFLRKTTLHRQKQSKGQRTAVPLVFMWIFKRAPQPKDAQVCRKLHKLLSHYCTKWTGPSTINGVKYAKTYHFSQWSCKATKRPYSLRLRLENLDDGKSPAFNMYLTNDKRANAKRSKSRRGSQPDGGHPDEGRGGADGGGASEGVGA